MVVCRYFLQPSGCRFGDKCRFEHVADRAYPEEGEYGAPRDSWQPRPRYAQQPQRYQTGRGGYDQQGPRGYQNVSYRQPAPANYDSPRFSTYANSPNFVPEERPTTDAEILEDVSRDIQSLWSQSTTTVVQKGKIWPFSSYSYISPDGKLFTGPLFGLADHSIEELRVEAYRARNDASDWQAYVEAVKQLGNSVRLACTSICNAADLPHSEGARKLIEEVRTKAAQHKASSEQAEANQPAPFNGGYQSAAYQSPPSHSRPPSNYQQTPSSVPPQNGQFTPQASVERHGTYSDTNMLSAEDFFQFASPEFTQGKVPYRPPPRNLC